MASDETLARVASVLAAGIVHHGLEAARHACREADDLPERRGEPIDSRIFTALALEASYLYVTWIDAEANRLFAGSDRSRLMPFVHGYLTNILTDPDRMAEARFEVMRELTPGVTTTSFDPQEQNRRMNEYGSILRGETRARPSELVVGVSGLKGLFAAGLANAQARIPPLAWGQLDMPYFETLVEGATQLSQLIDPE